MALARHAFLMRSLWFKHPLWPRSVLLASVSILFTTMWMLLCFYQFFQQKTEVLTGGTQTPRVPPTDCKCRGPYQRDANAETVSHTQTWYNILRMFAFACGVACRVVSAFCLESLEGCLLTMPCTEWPRLAFSFVTSLIMQWCLCWLQQAAADCMLAIVVPFLPVLPSCPTRRSKCCCNLSLVMAVHCASSARFENSVVVGIGLVVQRALK